jgi:hypothetical protein
MKNTKTNLHRHSKKSSLSGNPLQIKIIETKKDITRFTKLAKQFHYMGEGSPAGDTLRMVVLADGEWIGLLLWGSACYRLKHRDEWIGWTDQQRAARQKLIVQNRRFVLLAEPGEHPNLASRILGKVVRELPALWLETFGYEPLLAETFSDIEAREGTCYKASGWTALGKTKGYSRHAADYYVPNDRPKKLWVRELRKNATELLRLIHLPDEFEKGAASDADGIMPIKAKQIESLHEALCKVPDPRAKNCVYHIGAILSIVAMGVFSGHKDLKAIMRFAERLTLPQRKKLALPSFEKGSRYKKIPSYTAVYSLLGQLDLDAFSQVLSKWLAQHRGTLPVALAMDGKFIRDTIGLVTLAEHDTGSPVAMIDASQKKGEGERCELKAAQKMLCKCGNLTDTVITADALNTQKDTARAIVDRGGEYCIQVKGNQKTIHQEAELRAKKLAPLLPKPKKRTAVSTGAK